MRVHAVRTTPITDQQDILQLIDHVVPSLQEKSILAVTSKIVSISEGRTLPVAGTDKDAVIETEADWYLPRSSSKYNIMITIKDSIIIGAAGIDESNGNDNYILWPKNPYQTAQNIWSHLREKHQLQELGVIITDSRNTPTRWGTLGVGIAYCGFEPLKNYIGTPDIFGRALIMTKASILDGLAASAVLVMGEGNEQTPLAIIEDVPHVQFQPRPPTEEEKQALCIEKEDDLFEPLLKTAPWNKGKKQ
jgi:dihydrofolate synthase / folylpolyglutamate synthase